MEEEDLKERQENEMKVLQSMFLDDVKDLRKNDKWKTWRPPEILLTLRPQQSMTPFQAHVQVDLHVRCNSQYPNVVPFVDVCNQKGLSNQALAELRKELQELTKQFVGEVMVLELAQHVQWFLRQHNTPERGSFYDEMLKNKEKQEAEKAREQQQQLNEQRLEEEKQRQAFELEILRHRQEMRVEARRRRTNSKISDSKERNNCAHKPELLNFFSKSAEHTVQKGACLGHSERGHSTFGGFDTTTGELVCIIQWSLKTDYHVATVEQELQTLMKLKHTNLVHYIGSLYNPEQRTFYVLQEFVKGCPLSSFIAQGIPLDVALLRSYTTGILQALQYLHCNSVVHKDLKESSIFVDCYGVVKVADFSIPRKIVDLCLPASYDAGPACKSKKKNDILQFGKVLISLLRGEHATSTDIPSSLSLDARDFLERCLAPQEQDRWSCEQLLSHPFLMERGPSVENEPLDDEGPDESGSCTLSSAGHSRLQGEFEVLRWLGRGGFGDVFKVRNKLDRCVYAIKRIQLNPSSRVLNRKIMREVKLLSRLNHENVVRYYNSWIEVTTQEQVPETLASSGVSTESTKGTSHEWSMPGGNAEDSSSSDNIFGCAFGDSSSSDNIVFEGSREAESEVSEKPTAVTQARQFMFIQMEFCEKSTLRTAIDNGLHREPSRMWRLFREVIEGLAHIHQQGMIHRDLKPVNIFLDSGDHVKIGDFGLATTALLSRVETSEVPEHIDQPTSASLTGRVGTTLYTAPELFVSTGGRVVYSQKVDIYSLGIILFEMSWPAPNTAMERVKLLANLRLPSISLPTDACDFLSSQQISLICWLLHHDPSQRPSAAELLASPQLPPPHLQEAQATEVLNHTVSNPQSKAFKHLVNALFQQEATVVQDYAYDVDMRKGNPLPQSALLFRHVRTSLEHVLVRHGAMPVVIPTLLPKCPSSEEDDNKVHFMDHGGLIVSLPHNMRVPFARYIARRSDVVSLRRYAIEKVYRSRKVFGCHPRELHECAFDIVCSSHQSALTHCAEVLHIGSEIVAEFPELQARGYSIRLGHTGLMNSLLMHCGVPENRWSQILAALRTVQSSSKVQLQQELDAVNLGDQAVALLTQFYEVEDNLTKVSSMYRFVVRQKGPAAALARQALYDLEAVLQSSSALAFQLPVTIVPCLVCDERMYSGIVFEVACQSHRKTRRQGRDLLAVGGRYDKLVASFTVAGAKRDLAAVGISFSIEKIVQAVAEDGETPFLVECVLGNMSEVSSSLRDQQLALLTRLWSMDVPAVMAPQDGIEEASSFCRENFVPHLALLKEAEPGYLRLRSLEKDRFTEKRLSVSELCELFEKTPPTEPARQEVNSSGPTLRIVFSVAEKVSTSNRRRYESQIAAQLAPLAQGFLGRVSVVDVIAVELTGDVLRSAVALLNMEADGRSYEGSVTALVEKHPRCKKQLLLLAEKVYNLIFEVKRTIFVLYALQDNNYKVVIVPSRS
ncbi:eukaryotic translation initiation factor 2 alpha kinase Gcn2 [Dermacentor variabilis]|uniref:eukaryotic translation initiation factor 2 alpha kinase Gcn2 n=1 Tax=Dermacentor variabilis TaxID=34621 RepID=UPI003F5C87E5